MEDMPGLGQGVLMYGGTTGREADRGGRDVPGPGRLSRS